MGLFGKKPAPVYCKYCGDKLVVTERKIQHDPYTGKLEVIETEYTCPRIYYEDSKPRLDALFRLGHTFETTQRKVK